MSEKQPIQTAAIELPADSPGQAGRAWLRTEWMAAVFAVLLVLGMLVGYVNVRMDDPLKSVPLADLKEKLRLNPGDEPLKQNIRRLDLQLRQHYFRHLWRINSGVWLLLGAGVLFGIAGARVAHYGKKPRLRRPDRQDGPEAARAAALARWSVAACGASVGAGLFLASLGAKPALLEQPVEAAKSLGAVTGVVAPANDAAPLAELNRNWPHFRGPGGGGVSPFTNAPLSWDVKSGAGVAWKFPVPASGFNSPITWGDRVFFSGGDAAKREVFCLDGKTGQLLWRQPVANVPGAAGKPAEVPETTGYAAATMASDGRRVYVIFANGDVAAFTFEGKLVWSKTFGPLKNPYGHAASLATWRTG